MQAVTSYHEKILEITNDLINHGWGDCTFSVESLTDNKVRVVIKSGKSYVYIIKKTPDLSKKTIY